jgi:hypothetical protein
MADDDHNTTTPVVNGADNNKVSDQEYLEKHVFSAVHAGLNKLEKERPAAPIETLALFLLKHAQSGADEAAAAAVAAEAAAANAGMSDTQRI